MNAKQTKLVEEFERVLEEMGARGIMVVYFDNPEPNSASQIVVGADKDTYSSAAIGQCFLALDRACNMDHQLDQTHTDAYKP